MTRTVGISLSKFVLRAAFILAVLSTTAEAAFYESGYLPGRQPAPKIISHSQVFRAEQGEKLLLPCVVSNLGSFVLMWKAGRRVLTAGTLVVRKDNRIHLTDDFSLRLEDLRPEDQGTYICEVDVMGKPITLEHKVEVLVPPAVQAMPREGHVTVRKGNDVTIRCAGKGNPNPRITWSKKNGGQLPSGKQRQEGLSLEIRDVSRLDGGLYACTATNGVGKPAEAQIEVNVLYPPEIEIEQNWYEREGQVEVELMCIAHAQPEGQVYWYRKQKKLYETDRQLMKQKGSRNTLYIRNLQPADFGNYSCRAENDLGKARAYTSLSGHPRRPRFISDAVGYRAHTYNVTWTTDSYEPVTEYKLLYRRSDGLPFNLETDHIDESSGDWEVVAIPMVDPQTGFSAKMTYTLRGLRPSAVYDVVAKAKNQYGWSENSKIFNFFNKGVDYSTQQLSAVDNQQDDPLNGDVLEQQPPALVSPNLLSSAVEVKGSAILVLLTVALWW